MARKRKTPPPAEPEQPVNPEEIPLTGPEQVFVDEWVIDRRQARAYLAAFPGVTYNTACTAACKLKKKPNVAAAMRARTQDERRRTQVRADTLLTEIAYVAYSDIGDVYNRQEDRFCTPQEIPFETRKAIASIKISRERVRRTTKRGVSVRTTEQIIEYKFWDKLNAQEKLCRYLGLKTELSPLEALLLALPPQLAAEVREAMTTKATQPPQPSVNGIHR